RSGNFGDWHLRNSHQFLAPLRPGRNLLVVRLISGGANDWTMTIGHLPPRPGASVEPLPVQTHILPPLRWPTRDYRATGLRIEERPRPLPLEESRAREQAMSDHGVGAHWIAVVGRGPRYAALASSEFLPADPDTPPEWEEMLREQVAQIHTQGMSALSWFYGTHCGAAGEVHPDWQTVPFLPRPEHLARSAQSLCPLSPYGDALTGFVIESLSRYGLDGFWFDGPTWADRPEVACACPYCRRRFHEDTGLEFPTAADWTDPAFQHWVAWRYQAFMEFWGQLADRVRRVHPHATIVVNHLHRMRSPWHGAIPVDRYAASVMVGTEAMFSPFESAFHARLAAAYGKPDSEVWMGGLRKLHERTPSWPEEGQPVYRYVHHSLATLTAGSWPCFGSPGERLAEAGDILGSLINPRRPYLVGEPEPYVGLHLSQQSETLYFSRFSDWGFPQGYWDSLYGWHKLLCEQQLLTQIAFDAELTRTDLFKYPVFLAPLSVALSDAQVRLLEEYVATGGVLVAGPGFGACDEFGNLADPARVEKLLGHPVIQPQDAQVLLESEDPTATVRPLGQGQILELQGNAGLVFERRRSRLLAEEIGDLVREAAPPRVMVEGPPRLHLGLFRQPGRLYLHVQNFMAWSEAGGFPDPAIAAPPPTGELRFTLRGLNVHAARQVTAPDSPPLELSVTGDTVQLTLPNVEWGEILELEI
ncbi:MAG: hypothetical protein GX100_12545, partial [candidate division WS1 bacterium]|nr:hypothetical protein [candidate division WS1 bacterium]